VDLVKREFPVQGFSIETEHSRGGSLVAGHLAQYADDVIPLDVGEALAVRQSRIARRLIA